MWITFDAKNVDEKFFDKELLFKVKRHYYEKVEHQVGTIHPNGLAIIGGRFHYDWGEVVSYCELKPLLKE